MSHGRGHGRLLLLGILVVSACGRGGGKGGQGGTGGKGGASGNGGASGKGGASGNGGATGGGAGTGGMAGAGGSAIGGASGAGGASGGGAGSGGGGMSGAGGGAGVSGTAGGGAAGAGAAGAGGGAGTSGTGGSGGSANAGTGGSANAGTGGGANAGTGGANAGTGGGAGDCKTSVSGTVYDPAGTLPLYNVSVYAPTTALTAFSETVACGRCAALSGAPAAMTVSDTQGKFKLEGIPPGVNVPLVFEVGKWRREVKVPSVVACADTALTDANLTRLPRNQSEGHIPRVAITTGAADALECFLRRIGVADSEFTTDAGAGRVHLYAGGGGTDSFVSGGTFSAATTLWSSPTKLATYDMIGFSCEGSTAGFVDQKPQTSVDNIVAYANSGGRLLFTHLHFYWLQHAADFNGTASYIGNLSQPASPAIATINQTSAGGRALASWLAGPAVNASATLGQLSLDGPEHSVTSVNPPTTEWIYLPNNPLDSQNRRAVEFLGFQTPTTMPAGNQCGKVLFSDPHIGDSGAGAGGDSSGPSKPFPSGCRTNASTPEMKALEFLFFDLDACL